MILLIKMGEFWETEVIFVLERKKNTGNKMLLPAAGLIFAAVMQCGLSAEAAGLPEATVGDALIQHQSVSDNGLPDSAAFINSVSDNSAMTMPPVGEAAGDTGFAAAGEAAAPGADADSSLTDGAVAEGDAGTESGADVEEAPVGAAPEGEETIAAEALPEEKEEDGMAVAQEVDSSQLQTLNYKTGILTDWEQINEALRTLSPDALTDGNGGALVLRLQNVSGIPAGIKDSLASDGSGYAKYLHCNVGSGAALVFGGNTDNSGFQGVSDASVTVDSEKRGKKSMAVTVKFASHEDMGTVASLHVNLPQCSKGTKVSVYAETVSLDEEGNVDVGENACIGTTKADGNGNVEVPIQSTANYMFVYKAAKE